MAASEAPRSSIPGSPSLPLVNLHRRPSVVLRVVEEPPFGPVDPTLREPQGITVDVTNLKQAIYVVEYSFLILIVVVGGWTKARLSFSDA